MIKRRPIRPAKTERFNGKILIANLKAELINMQ